MTEPTEAFTANDLEVMSEAKNYGDWIFETLVRPHLGRRVLEVGCGIGTYSVKIAETPQVTELTCVDIERRCVQQATEALRPFGRTRSIQCREGDYATVDVGRTRYDTIVCLNVLEHLTDDRAAAAKAYGELAPGGRLVVFVPAFPMLSGSIDRRLGHFRRYTKPVARSVLEGAGFRVAAMRYYNVAGFFGWLVRFRFLQREQQAAGQVKLFDRWVLPVQAAVEARLPWLPFGQSLYAVGIKDEAGA